MAAAIDICVARHSETDWNAAGVLQGWADVPINQKGRLQAHALAEQIRHSGFTRVYSSPLIRARATADTVAATLGLAPPTCHEGLKERYFGVVQGIPKSELAELNPILFQHIAARNPACDFPQGEPMDEFADRVFNTLQDIAGRNAGQRVLVITHGWVVDVVARHLAGLPRNAILHLKPKNGDCLWARASAAAITRPAEQKPD